MPRKAVLILGEDDLIAWAIRKRFSAMKIPTVLVRTMEDALEELERRPYDLVVFDSGRLEGERPDVLNRIRAHLSEAGSPAEGGGGAGENRREEGGRTGIRWIEKPFSLVELDGIVEFLAGRFSEKRGCARNPCSIPIRISFVGPDGSERDPPGEYPTGTAAEVGDAGLRVSMRHPLNAGLRVRVSPLGFEDPMSGLISPGRTAEVIWVIPDEDGVIAGLRYLD